MLIKQKVISVSLQGGGHGGWGERRKEQSQRRAPWKPRCKSTGISVSKNFLKTIKTFKNNKLRPRLRSEGAWRSAETTRNWHRMVPGEGTCLGKNKQAFLSYLEAHNRGPCILSWVTKTYSCGSGYADEGAGLWKLQDFGGSEQVSSSTPPAPFLSSQIWNHRHLNRSIHGGFSSRHQGNIAEKAS